MKKTKKFKPGTTVVFDPSSFNQKYWAKLSEEKKIEYYGSLGYGSKKPKLFIFLAEIIPQEGHCILLSLDGKQIETMRHIEEFREATEDEV